MLEEVVTLAIERKPAPRNCGWLELDLAHADLEPPGAMPQSVSPPASAGVADPGGNGRVLGLGAGGAVRSTGLAGQSSGGREGRRLAFGDL